MDAFEKLMWVLGRPDVSLNINEEFIDDTFPFDFYEKTLVPTIKINRGWYGGFRPTMNILNLVYVLNNNNADYDVAETVLKFIDPVHARIKHTTERIYYNGAIIDEFTHLEPVELGIALHRLRYGKSTSAIADISLWFRYLREGKWSRWRWSDGTETLFYRGYLVGPSATVDVVNNHEVLSESDFLGNKYPRIIIGPMANAFIEKMDVDEVFKKLVPGWTWVGNDWYMKRVGNLQVFSIGDPRREKKYVVHNIFGEEIGKIPADTELTLRGIINALSTGS